MTAIGDYAFKTGRLTSIDLNNGKLQSIGKYAFAECPNLIHVDIPAGVTIGDYAFYSSGIKTVNIPPGITSIGDSAFQSSILTEIVIPEGVTSTGEYTFYGCASLTSVKLPKSLLRIEDYAFYQCGITSITIPKNVNYLGTYAFFSDSNLNAVKFRGPAPNLGGYVFYASGAIIYTAYCDFTYEDWSWYDINYIYGYNKLRRGDMRGASVTVNTGGTVQYAIGDDDYDVYSGAIRLPVIEGLKLKAIPNAGYAFGGWTGDVNDSNTDLTMPVSTNNISLTAKWTKLYEVVTVDQGTDGKVQYEVNNSGTWTDYTAPINVLSGGSVKLMAVPNDGFTFANWSGDSTSVNSIITLNTTSSVKANWCGTFTVTVDPGTNGKVQYDVDNTGTWTDYTVPIAAPIGKTVYLKAVAGIGYAFDRWSGSDTSAVPDISFASAANVTANWIAAATPSEPSAEDVHVLVSPVGGEVEPNGYVMINIGETLYLKLTPDEKYRVQIRVGEGDPERVPGPFPRIYAVEIRSTDDIFVEYIKQADVVIKKTENGRIEFVDISDSSRTVDVGAKVGFRIIVDKGYRLTELYINGKMVSLDGLADIMIERDTDLYATFSPTWLTFALQLLWIPFIFDPRFRKREDRYAE